MPMESRHSPDHFFDFALGWQKRCAEMVSPILLLEPAARHCGDTGHFQKLQAVEGVRGNRCRCRSVYGTFGQMDLREEIHRTLGWVARNALERVQRCRHLLRPPLERTENRVALRNVGFVALVASSRRVDHQSDGDLPMGVGAEGDRRQLVHLRLDASVDIVQLQVSASYATFPDEALGCRVKGDQLQGGRVHIHGNLLEGIELLAHSVHVFLIHLVREQDELLPHAKLNDSLHLQHI
mmetsp:Transcript_86423/g.241790  ORF Transcript_86423/g.241790 Transcript_86423/m.241790 type:complete len:238 (+) Transcript_86423:245-958(+)